MSTPAVTAITSEEEWLRCDDPELMEQFLGEHGSRRRWQLFACACCWRILPLIEDERSRLALAVAEREAEGRAGPEEVALALADAQLAELEIWSARRWPGPSYAAFAARSCLSAPRLAYIQAARAAGGGEADERRAQARLLRELFGNPFRPAVVEPAWRTQAVLSVARHVYDGEAFRDLPVLADALEDAGCSSEVLLAHLREPAFHVRGCWAVDAVLAKP